MAKGRSRAGRGPPGMDRNPEWCAEPLPGGSGSSRSARRCCGDEDDTDGPFRLLLVRAEMLHIGEGRPHGRIPCFPHDSGTLPRTSVFSGRAPMCRGARSAHGRISTALNAGEFPHDSADPPPTGSDRMCSTAPTDPMPHIRTRQHRPNTANTPPVRPTAARKDGLCAPR